VGHTDDRSQLRNVLRQGYMECARAQHIAAPQFGGPATLHAQTYSPVPVVIRSTPSVSDYAKVRKRGLRRLTNGPLPQFDVRFQAVSWSHRLSASGRLLPYEVARQRRPAGCTERSQKSRRVVKLAAWTNRQPNF